MGASPPSLVPDYVAPAVGAPSAVFVGVLLVAFVGTPATAIVGDLAADFVGAPAASFINTLAPIGAVAAVDCVPTYLALASPTYVEHPAGGAGSIHRSLWGLLRLSLILLFLCL